MCNSSNSEVDFKFRLFFFSTSDSVFRISFLTQGCSGLSVGVPCSSFRASFLVPEAALSDASCCWCCYCQALLSTIFGAGRGVESLSNKVLSLFLSNRFADAICRQYTIMAWDLVCQNCSPLSCARAKLIQQTAS